MKFNYWKYEKIPFARVKASLAVDRNRCWKRKERINGFERIIRKVLKGIYFAVIMMSPKVYLNVVALVTSYRCTLNCFGCGQHTPEINKMEKMYRTIDMEQIYRSMETLFTVVGGIKEIGIACGEAFINENLLEAIEYIGKTRKVIKINLPTNATVLPSDKILSAMKKYNVTATITKYPCVSQEKIDCLTKKFKDYGIQFSVYEDRTWFDLGKFEELDSSAKENKEKYENCERQWAIINNKELWKCVTFATAVFCGIEEKKNKDFVELSLKNSKIIKKKIKDIANKPYLDVCRKCHGMSGKDAIIIPAGQQIPRQ